MYNTYFYRNIQLHIRSSSIVFNKLNTAKRRLGLLQSLFDSNIVKCVFCIIERRTIFKQLNGFYFEGVAYDEQLQKILCILYLK